MDSEVDKSAKKFIEQEGNGDTNHNPGQPGKEALENWRSEEKWKKSRPRSCKL